MIITIEGKQGEGKSKLTDKITKGEGVLFISNYELLQDMDNEDDLFVALEHSDYLVVDYITDLIFCKKSVEKLQKRLPKTNFILITQSN